jgi:H+/Cl- antiporter ClcA
MLIGITLWIVIGACTGLLATRFIKLHGDDPRISMGVAGAAGLAAAFLYTMIAGVPITMWMPKAFLWSAVSGAVATLVWFFIRAKTTTRAVYTPRRSY